jgi:hypothetical protein
VTKKTVLSKRNFSEMAGDSKENSSRKRLLRLYSEESNNQSENSEQSDQDIRKSRRKN